jgi:multidrug efflux pump subunit AcrA (membrane-fusion protein)
VLCDGQVDVAALPVYRCLSIDEAGGGVRAIRGSFGQGHSGVPGRCGEWLAANSEYVGRGQPLARLISSARVTQNATALFRAILGNREGTPWRNFEDGVEHSQIAIARLNGDINDIALREQRLQAADDPTAGVQRQALGVEVDANEVPGAVGKFENECASRKLVRSSRWESGPSKE